MLFFVRRVAFLATALAVAADTLCSRAAVALPSFAEQTGQACSICHVGAFGPQLKQQGRDFKLFGYVSNDTKNHFPPIAAMTQTSFTHTKAAQQGGAAPGFGPNDNFSLDQVSLFYAGRILSNLGGFMQLTYDGVANRFAWDNFDIRHAREATVFDTDLVYGVTLNNNPSVQDLWNSTPAWGFPYTSSALAPTPAAAALIDGKLAQSVAGLGLYAMWNDFVYLELDGYRGLGSDVRNALGTVPVSGADKIAGFVPYWRVALQHEIDKHYFELGTYGIAAKIFPGGDKSAGTTDRIIDTAVDANYQWAINASNFVSAHATLIRENRSLAASEQLIGSNPKNSLSTFRADVSYSINNTFTPTVQYFQSRGSADAAFWGTASGSPNSTGWIAEIAYVPWGKPNSTMPNWLNARLSLQYVGYLKFDGATSHASDNNTLFLNLWLAFRF